jgi:hypothetical protein
MTVLLLPLYHLFAKLAHSFGVCFWFWCLSRLKGRARRLLARGGRLVERGAELTSAAERAMLREAGRDEAEARRLLTVGRCQKLNAVVGRCKLTHSLKAPGWFQPFSLQVNSWFQRLPFKCNLHRYITERKKVKETLDLNMARAEAGLCTSSSQVNAVDPYSLKPPGFGFNCYEVRTRFQSLLSHATCAARYTEVLQQLANKIEASIIVLEHNTDDDAAAAAADDDASSPSPGTTSRVAGAPSPSSTRSTSQPVKTMSEDSLEREFAKLEVNQLERMLQMTGTRGDDQDGDGGGGGGGGGGGSGGSSDADGSGSGGGEGPGGKAAEAEGTNPNPAPAAPAWWQPPTEPQPSPPTLTSPTSEAEEEAASASASREMKPLEVMKPLEALLEVDRARVSAAGVQGHHVVGRRTLCILLVPPPPRPIGCKICRPMRRLNGVCAGQ